MEEIGKALKTIFDKLSDFFDIFDLSFFVSGVATTIVIAFWLHQRSFLELSIIITKYKLIVLLLLCYINGLLSFAIGRWIRMEIGGWIAAKFNRKRSRCDLFETRIVSIIKAHGLEENEIISTYLSRTGGRSAWRLYVRFWAVIREEPKYSHSLSLLKRYWVMAATYDGLSISMVWTILLFLDLWIGITGPSLIVEPWFATIALVFLIVIFIGCVREASRYVDYQIEEVVATIAAGSS